VVADSCSRASTIDQRTHLLRPATFDVIAGVRVVRIGRHTGFGRVMLLAAADQRSVGTVAGIYSMPRAAMRSASGCLRASRLFIPPTNF
jgi:hypothetical protein